MKTFRAQRCAGAGATISGTRYPNPRANAEFRQTGSSPHHGNARARARSSWRSLPLLVLMLAAAMFVPSAHAAGPYPTNLCTAGRVSNLNCTANDVEVGSIQVLNGITTCTAGEPVTLDLRAFLHVNSQDRHDIGLFLAKDGRSPALPVGSGGSADCAVYGVPQSPVPFANLDGNACGAKDEPQQAGTQRYVEEHKQVFRRHFGRALPGPLESKLYRLIHLSKIARERRSGGYRQEVLRLQELAAGD
jgi:hypothetical protein